MYSLLLLDDDPLEHRALKRNLVSASNNQNNFEVFSALNIENFNQILSREAHIDFVLLDIYLTEDVSQKTGLNLIEKVKIIHPKSTILISSNCDDPHSVLLSLTLGADEFLSKKYLKENLVTRLLDIQEKAHIKKGFIKDVQKRDFQKPYFSGHMMTQIEQRIPNIIQSAIKFIYIEGQSGTGKEVVADLFARYLTNQPFVKLNCAAIPKDLIESELFGHKKGSFTGAFSHKMGVLEAANGGWLFLDEVSSLTPSAQSALLRALENQEITPIGETKSRKINVHFISASNISLEKLVEQGLFRNDLWQRLRETEIRLLPLSERKSEIPQLVEYFCNTMEGGPYKIEDTALQVLCQLPWSEGNVRELRNCLRAMTENHNNKVLSPMGIPSRILVSYQDHSENNVLERKFQKQKVPLEDKENEHQTELKICCRNSQGNYYSFEQMSLKLLQGILHQEKTNKGKINLTKLSQDLKIARSTLQLKLKQLERLSHEFTNFK